MCTFKCLAELKGTGSVFLVCSAWDQKCVMVGTLYNFSKCLMFAIFAYALWGSVKVKTQAPAIFYIHHHTQLQSNSHNILAILCTKMKDFFLIMLPHYKYSKKLRSGETLGFYIFRLGIFNISFSCVWG